MLSRDHLDETLRQLSYRRLAVESVSHWWICVVAVVVAFVVFAVWKFVMHLVQKRWSFSQMWNYEGVQA